MLLIIFSSVNSPLNSQRSTCFLLNLDFISFAGLPPTNSYGPTSLVTTEPAAITAPFDMVTDIISEFAYPYIISNFFTPFETTSKLGQGDFCFTNVLIGKVETKLIGWSEFKNIFTFGPNEQYIQFLRVFSASPTNNFCLGHMSIFLP